MKQMNKKGFNIGDLLPIGMTLVVLTIGLAVGLQVTGDVQDDMTPNSTEYNATGEGIAALAQIPGKLGIIVTVIVAAVIIGILIRYLMMRNA